jgi:hypothetical protein
MAVCTMARARATTAGAGRAARTAARVSSSQRNTTSSVGDGPYRLNEKVESGPGGSARSGPGGSVGAAAAHGATLEVARTKATTRVRMAASPPPSLWRT